MELQPSVYQQQVLNFVQYGRGHGIVEAVAGSGKTTMLSMVANSLKSSGIAVCFNKHASTHLQEKLFDTQIQALTFHSLGYRCLRDNLGELQVDNNKYVNESEFFQKRNFGKVSVNAKVVTRIFNLLRLNCLKPTTENIQDLVLEHFQNNIEVLENLQELAFICEHLWEFGQLTRKCIDFTDMIWLPVELNLQGKQYPWVLVDEGQDTSNAQFALIKRSVRKSGRILFVGDRRQAIYHFAGANAQSFQNIQNQLEATLLPLSVCYRCPKKIIDFAKNYCPQIEAAPDAIEGEIRRISVESLLEQVQEGDLILSRLTAPVVSLCYKLIANKISAAVKGRSIGEGLIALINKLTGKNPDEPVELLFRNLQHWRSEEERKIQAIPDESVQDRMREIRNDQYQCLVAVFENSQAQKAADLIASIEDLFSDDRVSVLLSTIHRAKGLEESRVFVLWPLSRWSGVSETQAEQERNLAYVAITRASKQLFLVHD